MKEYWRWCPTTSRSHKEVPYSVVLVEKRRFCLSEDVLKTKGGVVTFRVKDGDCLIFGSNLHVLLLA